MFNNDDNRGWQRPETFYVTSTGEVFYTPDGEGRYYYDSLEEALAEVGEARESATIVDLMHKEQAQSYAKARNIEVAPEVLGHDGPAVEVWSYQAHLSEADSQCHTYFATGESWAAAWGDALDYMKQLETCPQGCTCYDTNDHH